MVSSQGRYFSHSPCSSKKDSRTASWSPGSAAYTGTSSVLGCCSSTSGRFVDCALGSAKAREAQWQRIKRAGETDIPEGMVMYGFRHFFASNCLSNRIPITDVAEWMGHKSIDVTFKIYRHLMPGSIGRAAKLLDMGLAT
ncbi:tyrosine-type recombinase/integrase [Streptomyces sp. NPDC056237]|uniref:tyrosine-type recombinase/integrase n=1 Tax=unclassified Streptomyces TaxID=2593676 RepID=UPI0035DC07F2